MYRHVVILKHSQWQATYFRDYPETPEAQLANMHVVGVGHHGSEFGLTDQTWDGPQLRALRRRDFPPYNHPAVTQGHGVNLCAKRLVEILVDQVQRPYTLRPGG